jgi:predicted transcriptional regulator
MRTKKAMDPFSVLVREQLEEAMRLQGFNRHTLFQESGVAYTTIMRILNADIAPRTDTIDKLFRAMDLEPRLSFD